MSLSEATTEVDLAAHARSVLELAQVAARLEILGHETLDVGFRVSLGVQCPAQHGERGGDHQDATRAPDRRPERGAARRARPAAGDVSRAAQPPPEGILGEQIARAAECGHHRRARSFPA